MQRLLPVYRADPERLRPVVDPTVLAPRRAVSACDQAGLDRLLGPEAVWELYGGTELQALTFISGDSVADPSRLGGRRRHRRDEGARRRRQRMRARRRRRDLHAARPGQRADLPLHRRDGQEPRRLGFARRPRLLRRRRASSTSATGGSTCSPSAAATSTPPRSRRRSPSIQTILSCLVVGVPDEARSRPGAARAGARPTAPRRGRVRHSCADGWRATRCRARSSSSTAAARRRGQGPPHRRCATTSSRDRQARASR